MIYSLNVVKSLNSSVYIISYVQFSHFVIASAVYVYIYIVVSVCGIFNRENSWTYSLLNMPTEVCTTA